ncbi:MAG: hypothetical protein WKF84_13555 [Pyrinomonadaceae bacterium]
MRPVTECGRETTEFHCYDRLLTLRHLPMLERQVFIRLRSKRCRCPSCSDKPTSTQQLSWYESGSSQTKAYEQYLLLRLVNGTIEDVSSQRARRIRDGGRSHLARTSAAR